jgi:hypothetical protein
MSCEQSDPRKIALEKVIVALLLRTWNTDQDNGWPEVLRTQASQAPIAQRTITVIQSMMNDQHFLADMTNFRTRVVNLSRSLGGDPYDPPECCGHTASVVLFDDGTRSLLALPNAKEI